MIIGNSRSPAEDGLKKLQDAKEQQMVFKINVSTKSMFHLLTRLYLSFIRLWRNSSIYQGKKQFWFTQDKTFSYASVSLF